MRKLLFHGSFVLLLVAGAAAVADALVVTDQERLEAFADVLSGEIEVDRIDEGLGYVDVEREAVVVSTPEGDWEFEDGQGAELSSQVRDVLRPYLGHTVEVLQRSIELRDEDALVVVRLRTPEGMIDLSVDLTKHEERWYVRRARVR